MKVLGIDTSRPWLAVRLRTVEGDLVRFSEGRSSHNERLVPAVEELLGARGLVLADLDALAVVHGPGSFTGLRIGCATVKALAWGAKVPLYSADRLDLLSRRSPSFPVLALVDAQRDAFYAGLFEAPGRRVGERLDETRERCSSFFADPAAFLASRGLAGNRLGWIGEGDWGAGKVSGEAADLSDLLLDDVERRIREGEAPLDPFLLAPLYLRASEAERKIGL